MDGFPSLFAHVFLTGVVDDRRSVGITEENVRLVEREVTDNKGRRLIYFHYCLTGLPPLMGGQVTMDGGGAGPGLTANLNLDTGDPECPIMVTLNQDDEPVLMAGAFYIQLY
jgi:hypothetical protein